MMINLLLWYLVVALAGWLAFPLAFRLLAFLPDRGLALSRPLGLLLWGYAFWLLVSLGVLQNNLGGVILSLALVAGLSLWQLKRSGRAEMFAWLRERGRLALVIELLFLVLFGLWAVIRAANPDASGTEKPMELAFINAILRSPAFPPSDPWLAGYAISYYYFGYVIVAILARAASVPGSVAFNLAIATWFALTGTAAYGLLYNLLAIGRKPVGQYVRSFFAPLLAPLFLLFASNLEGFFELLHACGSGSPGFWKWLNIQELVNPPVGPFNCIPNRPGGIWWWRASRVLQDFDLNGATREIIDEFPMFSFILSDLHPHVLAMPFVLLAVGLALNMYLQLRSAPGRLLRVETWVTSLQFWAAAVIFGGLSFLNTWDFPIYVALFAAAVVTAQFYTTGWRWQLTGTFVQVGIALGLAGIVLYLPFYLGFASQASGILPSLVFFTRGIYFWVMFGVLLLPILAWLVWLVVQRRRESQAPDFGFGIIAALALVFGLWALSMLLGLRVVSTNPDLARNTWGAVAGAPLLSEALVRRLQSPGTWLSLLGLLALTWALLQSFRQRADDSPDVKDVVAAPAVDPTANPEGIRVEPFVLLLILLGTGLVLFPEFFYLRDQFGWRMNTIFKFYFQTWIVWAVAAGYASSILWQRLRKSWQVGVFSVLWVALLAMALVYPIANISERLKGQTLAEWTLDGAAYIERFNTSEMDAVHWLETAPYGVVTEAVGGSYSGYARVSMLTGMPTVLGWPGHESQWRGGAKEIGSREQDIAQLYKARTWDQLNLILNKYNIRYIYLGGLERSLYHPDELVFQQYLKPVFHNETVTIFEVPSSALGQAVNP